MTFIPQVATAVLCVALTLWLQAAGLTALISGIRPLAARGIQSLHPFRATALVVQFTAAIIVLHTFQICLWAIFYRWLCFTSWESAFFASASTFATVGYGDVMLPDRWRLLAPLESIVGTLMVGISVSLIFAITTRLVGHGGLSAQE